MSLGVGHTQSITPVWIATDNLTTYIITDWSSSRGNIDDGSLVSCPAHGLYTVHESEEAGWSHSYGLGWTVAAAAGRTGNVWMSPRWIKKRNPIINKHRRDSSDVLHLKVVDLLLLSWQLQSWVVRACLPRWALVYLEERSWRFDKLADLSDLAGRKLTRHGPPGLVVELTPWQYLQVWSSGHDGGHF